MVSGTVMILITLKSDMVKPNETSKRQNPVFSTANTSTVGLYLSLIEKLMIRAGG